MPKRNMQLSTSSMWLARCVLFLLAASLWSGSATATISVTATKDCSTSPCTVVLAAPITIMVAQTIQWQATYTGSATQGHSFYLTTSPQANLADIALTTSGQPSGSFFLSVGTYYISIKLALMGPGAYTVTFNPSSTGEPHITTTNGSHYDFQGVGEFVLLRQPDGQEIQARQGPIPTTYNPGPDPHDELAMCVSINTAIAARVGTHRVTYEPNLSGVPDPSGLQLRVDGVLTTPGPTGIDLGNRARITSTTAPGGLEIDFPDGSNLFVTPNWWADQGRWFLNLDIAPARDGVGLAGPFAPRSWLPGLPDGTSMGPMPSSLHDRYVDLYQKFSDAWRVKKENSLFDYAPGTSTNDFTMHNWPPEHPPCSVPGTIPAEPVSEKVAKLACQSVTGENAHCIYDVTITGNPAFAITYAFSQGLKPSSTIKPCGKRLVVVLTGLLLLAVLLLLICLFRR